MAEPPAFAHTLQAGVLHVLAEPLALVTVTQARGCILWQFPTGSGTTSFTACLPVSFHGTRTNSRGCIFWQGPHYHVSHEECTAAVEDASCGRDSLLRTHSDWGIASYGRALSLSNPCHCHSGPELHLVAVPHWYLHHLLWRVS